MIYGGGKLNLVIANQLTNDKSSMVTQSDITINGTNLTIDNKSGSIQSDENINISAKTLNNTAYHYDTKEKDTDNYYGYDVNEKVSKSGYVMNQTVVMEQDEQISTLGSKASFISSLKNIVINLSNELSNSSSIINAKENLTITAHKTINETDSVSTHGMYRKWGKYWRNSYKDCGWSRWRYYCNTKYRYRTTSWTDTRKELAYSKDKGALAAGQNLTINAQESITNGEVVESNEFLTQSQADYQNNNSIQDALASNGQFKVNKPSANQPYVIETRSQFIDINKFKASQYLFARPNIRFLDPTTPNPIVMGDAYWEHQRLQRQIAEQTKKAELYTGLDMNAIFERLFTQSNEEFEKLTAAGVEVSFGVALSKEAIRKLTQDIVWYENEDVVIDGEKQIALVPTLYLANSTLEDLEKKPQAFLAAKNISLNSDGTIANRGKINSDNNTNITADSITNQGGIIEGNDVNITAKNVIINQSGDIKANNDLNLKAQTIANIASEKTDRQRRDIIKTVGNNSNLEGGNINLNANDVINTASNISAENLDITANNINIGTQQNTTDLKEGGGNNYSNSQSVNHQKSNINVSSNLKVKATNVNISGSKVVANNSNIVSDNLIVSSVQDSKSVQMKSKSSGGLFGGSSESTLNSQKTITQGSELDIANNLTLKNQQTKIIASKIKAKTLEIQTELLKLISAKDINFEQIQSNSSGFLTTTAKDKGKQREKITAAQIQAEKLIINGKPLKEILTPQAIEQQVLQTLSSQDKLTKELKKRGISLESLTANNKEWNESITTLSGVGQLVVQAVVTYFTAGAGNAAVASTSEAIKQAATQAAMTTLQKVAATAIQSVVNQAAASIADSAITGNGLNLDLETITKNALTAGATKYATLEHTIDVLNNDFKMADYTKNAAVQGTIEGINAKLIDGSDFASGFKAGAINSVVADSSLQMRKYVKDNFFYIGKDGNKVPKDVRSVGVRNDKARLAGSNPILLFEYEYDIKYEEISGPTGGSQIGKRTLFGFEYPEGGLIDKTMEYFAGPHDFMSSWNYKNKDNKTYLKNDNLLIKTISAGLLIPALPFATAPAIKDLNHEIWLIKQKINKDKQKINLFKEKYIF